MAAKQTEGWVVYRPAQGGLKESYYYNHNGAPYKRRSDALRKLKLVRAYYMADLFRVSMFYEPDNET